MSSFIVSELIGRSVVFWTFFGVLLIIWIKVLDRWKFDRRLNIPYGWGPSRWNPFAYELTALAMSRDNPHFGNMLMSTIQFFSSAYESAGLYRFYLLFRPIVVCVAPETAEAILSNGKIIDKGFFYDLLKPWLGQGLLTSSGSKWRSRRKLLTPAFHFRILEDFVTIFNEQSMLMGDLLLKDSMRKPVDICKRVTNCTLDIICETAMGVRVNAQKNADSAYVRAVYPLGSSFLKRCMRPWQWIPSFYYLTSEGSQYKNNLDILHGFTKQVISERREKLLNQEISSPSTDGHVLGAKKRKAFLDMLLEHHLNHGELSLDDIQEEVDTFMFEGHDTTAMGISWCLYLVGLDRSIQQKLHEELDAVFGDDRTRFVTADDLSQLKYLECCLKESLRLFPSVPFIAREPSIDVIIGKSTIPRGTTCVINLFHVHRNKRFFRDPETFDPDRFLPQNCHGRHPFAFIPFSAGSRNCIGQRFAQLEEKIVLANIFRRFEIRSTIPRDKLILVGEMVIRSLHGLHVRVRKR